jgi:hypothetical protein
MKALQIEDFDLGLTGFDQAEIDRLLDGAGLADNDSDASGGKKPDAIKLADRFGVPPFSVLNAREGWWQDRKRDWISLGIRSELGRGDDLLGNGGGSTSKARYDGAKKADAKTFGDAAQWQRRRAIPGGGTGQNSAWLFKTPAGYSRQHVSGVLMKSDSGNDPQYYYKKQQAEQRLGRELTTEEFQAEHYDGPSSYESGTSIFDPVLCELVYRWFSASQACVLDPFAGGSVRGIVAAKLNRRYVGVELRPEQVEANRQQIATILGDVTETQFPTWHVGDSREIRSICSGLQADLIFSCPPYGDLERYSNDEADLSTMSYDDFIVAYRQIIAESCSLLKDDRFACFVVGEIRDKRTGLYRNFVGDTVEAFRAAGLAFYNEAILVTAVGSLPIRAGKIFASTRKLGKTHQNVLVFVKGDPRAAAASCGICDFGDVAATDEGADV